MFPALSSSVRNAACMVGIRRVVCSLLSRRAIRIDNIRPFPTSTDLQTDIHMGLMEHEAAFLRLVDKLTNGTKVKSRYHIIKPRVQ